MPTGISWTDETWNPITGCSRVSDGCRHCYAEQLSLKHGWSQFPWTAQHAKDNIKLHPDRLNKPLAWKQPRMIFVNSMSDMFHELVHPNFLDQIFDVIRRCPQHTFQILTKRPERALAWSEMNELPAHVWIGTSVEDQRVVHRIDHLRKIEAAVKFISFEPLIGSVGNLDLRGIHWAIVGGESGDEFRPMDHAWAREIRDQCVAAGVAFFFKQDASKRPGIRPLLIEADGAKTEWRQYPGAAGIAELPPTPAEVSEPQSAWHQMEMFE